MGETMSQPARIALTICVSFPCGVLGLIAGVVFAASTVYIVCRLLSYFHDDPGVGGAIFYIGGFAALFAAAYGGFHGLVSGVKYGFIVAEMLAPGDDPQDFDGQEDDRSDFGES